MGCHRFGDSRRARLGFASIRSSGHSCPRWAYPERGEYGQIVGYNYTKALEECEGRGLVTKPKKRFTILMSELNVLEKVSRRAISAYLSTALLTGMFIELLVVLLVRHPARRPSKLLIQSRVGFTL